MIEEFQQPSANNHQLKKMNISDFKNPFFIGVAGVGMSAIAQYLQGIGKNVSGSDRYFHPDEYNKTKEQLENQLLEHSIQMLLLKFLLKTKIF